MMYLNTKVAPYVGAWIETYSCYTVYGQDRSHPTWVRGLKHVIHHRVIYLMVSHPTWVRGLKRVINDRFYASQLSHPTWVRGLKL